MQPRRTVEGHLKRLPIESGEGRTLLRTQCFQWVTELWISRLREHLMHIGHLHATHQRVRLLE